MGHFYILMEASADSVLSLTVSLLLGMSADSWLGHVLTELLCQGTQIASHKFSRPVRGCTHMHINPGRQESRIITVQYYIWEDLIKSVCHYLSVSLPHFISICFCPLPNLLSSTAPMSLSLTLCVLSPQHHTCSLSCSPSHCHLHLHHS